VNRKTPDFVMNLYLGHFEENRSDSAILKDIGVRDSLFRRLFRRRTNSRGLREG